MAYGLAERGCDATPLVVVDVPEKFCQPVSDKISALRWAHYFHKDIQVSPCPAASESGGRLLD
jgi:hypothetical protein